MPENCFDRFRSDNVVVTLKKDGFSSFNISEATCVIENEESGDELVRLCALIVRSFAM